jgi:hypothetical protein
LPYSRDADKIGHSHARFIKRILGDILCPYGADKIRDSLCQHVHSLPVKPVSLYNLRRIGSSRSGVNDEMLDTSLWITYIEDPSEEQTIFVHIPRRECELADS